MADIDDVLSRLERRAGHPLKGTATLADVVEAERRLGVRLPPTYVQLVTRCGQDDLPHHVRWVGPNSGGSHTLVAAAEGWDAPSFLIEVSGDGGENLFCFDCRSTDASGEYPIVWYDIETHRETSRDFEKVADDVAEFLADILDGSE